MASYNNHRYVSQVQKDAPRHEPTYNANKIVGYVTEDVVNIRASAEPDGEIKAVARKNELLVVDKEKSTADYYKVSTENGLGGFVMKDLITLKED